MATRSRSSRNEENDVSKGIIQSINEVAGVENGKWLKRVNTSDEHPTVADLVLPGTGYKFSDEFACLLRVLGGERESA